jgi:DNA ligase-associated metallophosphoesterase
MDFVSLVHRDIELVLTSLKAIWYESEKMLIISDLHAGKTQHFRKNGIPIPMGSLQTDLQQIEQLINYYKPGTLCITGDFFHSDFNKEFYEIVEWRKKQVNLEIVIIKGNHDILDDRKYENIDIQVVKKSLKINELVLTHIYQEEDYKEDVLVISGHIHPRITLRTSSRQYIKMQCYLLRNNHLLMPAFGSFTGGYNMDIMKGDRVFAIGGDKIIAL